jgi:hypothetical protein
MTNFIKTRSFDQRNGQGGFAIGLILLVVLLIAVIVGAIAIASRSSSNSGTQEKDRVAASSLLTQAQTINNGFTRATQGGGFAPANVYMSYSDVPAVRDDQANLIGRNGYFAPPSINHQAYVATTCPVNTVVSDVAKTCQLILTSIDLQVNNALSTMVYTLPLTDPVTRQVNAVLWGAATSGDLPLVTVNWDFADIVGKHNAPSIIGNPAVLTAASAALQSTTAIPAKGWYGQTTGATGLEGSYFPAINGDQRPEGAFNSGLVNGNIYYRILDNL